MDFSKPKIASGLLGNNNGEQVVSLRVYELVPFAQHPFKVLEDEGFDELKQSIQDHGVSTPIIVRTKGRGAYEIISGHRRAKACELLELETIPAIIRDLDDDDATLFMVDTNIQREMLLPSEKAFAYKMKLDAIKRKAGRPEKNGDPVEHHLKSRDLIAQNSNDSGVQIQRFIRLTHLIPDFLEFADCKKLPFQVAVELSHLTHDEQEDLNQVMTQNAVVPTLLQATELKKLSKEKALSIPVVTSLLAPVAQAPKPVSLKIAHHFPEGTSKKEMTEVVDQLLSEWAKRQR